jgi:hypothetical protein
VNAPHLNPIFSRIHTPYGQIHLSWKEAPATSLTVIFQTDDSVSGAWAEIKSESCAWHREIATSRKSPGKGYLHEVTFRGLSPNTRYAYRVGADTWSPSASLFTCTAPVDHSVPFSFGFITDTGLADRIDGNATGVRAVRDSILARAPLFLLGAGDYAYANRDVRFARIPDAIDAWFAQYEPVLSVIPMLTQYGNHEIMLEEWYHDWAPRFAQPAGFDEGRCYSFDVAGVHIAAFFAPDGPPTREQIRWLDQDLGAARARGVRWLIVFQHESIWGHGGSHPAFPELRRKVVPVLERHRVDLHLAGHDQNFERTYPLRDIDRVMSTDRERYPKGLGVVYAKISPAGKRSEIGNDFSKLKLPLPPVIAVSDDTAHHFSVVTVAPGDGLVVETFRVERDGAPVTLLDRFVIGEESVDVDLARPIPSESRQILARDLSAGATTSPAARPHDPGEFTAEGWRINSARCQLKYDLGRAWPCGRIDVAVRGPLNSVDKRLILALWNEEAATDGDRKSQSFLQARLMQRGAMLRLTHRAGGSSFEGLSAPLVWNPANWVRFRITWDTRPGGVCELWRDGELLQRGTYNSSHPGLRWLFLGCDNYQELSHSIMGLTFRDLQIEACEG